MARLYTGGAETGHLRSENITIVGGVTIDNTVARTGSSSFKCTNSSEATLNATVGTGTYYARAYCLSTGIPGSSMATLLHVDNSALIGAWLDSSGNLGLGSWISGARSPTFSGSARYTWVTNQWTMLEMRVVKDAGGNYTTVELRVNGTSLETWTGSVASNFARFEIGDTGGTSGFTYWADDIAVNDTSGTDQNSWPGPGSIVTLLPTSDSANASGNWIKPGGATTRLYSSLDNVPPTGIAFSTNSADAEKQIYNARSSATDDYDANMTTYTAAGIGANDVVNVIAPFCVTGTDSTSSVPAGGILTVSNPAQRETAFASFSNGVAATFPTGWKYVPATPTYRPSLTLGTAPVLRVGKRTATTTAAMLTQVGVHVEFQPVTIQAVTQGTSVGAGTNPLSIISMAQGPGLGRGTNFTSIVPLSVGQALGLGTPLTQLITLLSQGSSLGRGTAMNALTDLLTGGAVTGDYRFVQGASLPASGAIGVGVAMVASSDFPVGQGLAQGNTPLSTVPLDIGPASAFGLEPISVNVADAGGAIAGGYEFIISFRRLEPSTIVFVDKATRAAILNGQTVALVAYTPTDGIIDGDDPKTFVTLFYQR